MGLKNKYRGGGLPEKGGFGQFADLKGGGGGGLARKSGLVFLRGVDTPMHIMIVDRSQNFL